MRLFISLLPLAEVMGIEGIPIPYGAASSPVCSKWRRERVVSSTVRPSVAR
jgi:hypothetical protein